MVLFDYRCFALESCESIGYRARPPEDEMPDPHHHVPTAREIMTRSLITIAPDSSVFAAIRTLVKRKISGAPVVDADGKPIGALHIHDLIRAGIA